MTRRRRAQLTRWAVYVVTLLIILVLALTIDWDHVREALFEWSTVKEQFPDILTRAARNTLIFTALGFSGGLVLGLFIALMRLSSIGPYRWFAITYIEVFRGLPALLTITFIGFGLPIALDVHIPGTYGQGTLAL